MATVSSGARPAAEDGLCKKAISQASVSEITCYCGMKGDSDPSRGRAGEGAGGSKVVMMDSDVRSARRNERWNGNAMKM
jgi:hypothetical protein